MPDYPTSSAGDQTQPRSVRRHPRCGSPGAPGTTEMPRRSTAGQGASRRPGVDQLDAGIFEVGQISGNKNRAMRLGCSGDHSVLDRDRLASCLAVSTNLTVARGAFAVKSQNFVPERDLEQRGHAGRQIIATAADRHAHEATLDFSHTDCSRINAVRHLLSQETDDGWVGGRTNKLGDDIRVEQDHRSPNSGGGVSGARPRGGMSSSTPRSGPNSRRAISTILSRGAVPCRARAVRNNSRASSSSERRCSAARALSRLCKALSTFRISKLTTRPPLRAYF